MERKDIQVLAKKVADQIGRVIVGKRDTVELLLTAMIARGHVLLEDVPGTGKTVMAKSLAKSLSCGFSRIQFTPDLLPSDVTGLSVYDASSNSNPARCSPTCCWPTKSTAPPPARRALFWSAWKNGR